MPQNRTFQTEFKEVPEQTANKVAAICFEEVAVFFRHLALKYSLEAATDAEKEKPVLSPTLSIIVERLEQVAVKADEAAEIYNQMIAEKESSPQ